MKTSARMHVASSAIRIGGGDVKERFNASANAASTWKRENMPDPAKVAERGIKTQESLAYLAAQHPAPPEPSYDIDQENTRQAALEQERARQRMRVNWMRERLHERPEKARQDFRTARDYRGHEQER